MRLLLERDDARGGWRIRERRCRGAVAVLGAELELPEVGRVSPDVWPDGTVAIGVTRHADTLDIFHSVQGPWLQTSRCGGISEAF